MTLETATLLPPFFVLLAVLIILLVAPSRRSQTDDASSRPWFRERTSGLGWTPVTREGWAVTVASAATVIIANLVLLAHLGAFRR